MARVEKKEKPVVEYYMRCMLPSASGYSSGPSGDTEYDSDYREAIFKNKPEGFEIAWPTQRQWPRIDGGYTLVKLYLSDKKMAIENLNDQLIDARKEIQRIRDLIKQI